MDAHRSTIVVGGGFACTPVARQLSGCLPAGVVLTLVSEERYTTFDPMLLEAVGASIFPEQVAAHLRQIIRPGADAALHHGPRHWRGLRPALLALRNAGE